MLESNTITKNAAVTALFVMCWFAKEQISQILLESGHSVLLLRRVGFGQARYTDGEEQVKFLRFLYTVNLADLASSMGRIVKIGNGCLWWA